MTPRSLLPLLALGGTLLAASPAVADTLETSAPGAANLAAGAGYLAWNAAQADGTNRLVVRRPDGSVVTPGIAPFRGPVDPSIGTLGGYDGTNTAASRRLSVVYSRCAGSSTLAGCDIYALDLTTLEESKVTTLSTKTYSETTPSVNLGNWSFVRRGGGKRPGTYTYTTRRGAYRLSPTLARDTVTTTSRTLFTYNSSRGFGVQIRISSGHGTPLVAAARLSRQPAAPQLTRYRAGWLLPAAGAPTQVFVTERFAGSGGPYTLKVKEAGRTLPAGVTSAAGDASTLFTRYLDAAGVQRIAPTIR